MIKNVLLLSATVAALSAEVDYTKNISTDIRAVYVNYNYDRGFSDAEAFATSLKLKYEQEMLEGLTGGIAFGTVQDLGILDYDKSENKRNMAYIFDKNKEKFSILHQAYLKYNYSKSYITLGRFELETPLISSDDYFVLSNTFQGIHVDIKEFENYTFRAGYISDMSGAWDSNYDGATFNSMTKQTLAHRADRGSEHYYDLVDDFNVSDAGYAYIGTEFDNDTLKVKLYDYMLIDAYNSIFAQVDYIFPLEDKKLLIGGQYIRYDGIGTLKNNPIPEAVVDYATYSAKAELSSDIWNVRLAYTGVSDTGSIHFFGAHGAYQQFANGGMVNYFDTSLRDAEIFSLSSSFNFGNNKNAFNISGVYAYYDLNSDYTKGGFAGDSINGDSYMNAYGVNINYTFDKTLSFTAKVAQRRLEHGDENLLFRTIVKYTF